MLERAKTAKRRTVQNVLEKTGKKSSSEVGDLEFEAQRKCYQAMMADIETLGAGVSSHLVCTYRLYENSSKLSKVLAELEPRRLPPSVAVRDGSHASSARWAYLHSTTRRSMNAVVVDRGLDPLRNIVRDSREVAKTCARRDGALVDVRAYDRRKDESKLDSAKAKYEEFHETARVDVQRAKVARDVVVADTAAALLSTQAELAACSAQYLEEVADALAAGPREKVASVRQQMRDLMENGGPDLVKPKRGFRKTAFQVGFGKKTVEEVRTEKNEELERRRLQRQAKQQAEATYDPDMLPKVGLAVHLAQTNKQPTPPLPPR